MRLLVLNYEYPPLGGGAGNATRHMARCMAAFGVDVKVITSACGALPAREVQDGFEILRVPALRRREDRGAVHEMAAYMVSATVRGLMLARSWRPDACLAFFGVPGGPPAWILRRVLGLPYIVSLRGADVPGFWYQGLGIYHRLCAPVIRLVWRKAHAVVANSPGLLDLALKTEDSGNMRVIPNGVDCDLYRPGTPRSREGLLRLVTVGRMVLQKGVDVLLDALALTDASLRLSVVGDGDDRPAFEARARGLGLADRVEFLGWRSRAEVAGILSGADMFVLPSRSEGMSNAILEAMACGLPVVASDIAPNAALVRDGVNGRLAPVGDAGALADALSGLAADASLRRRMGAVGRDMAQRDFSWESVSSAYLKLAEEAISGARKRRAGETDV